MSLRLEAPLTLTLLGLLASGCEAPQTDDANDDVDTETDDTESDSSSSTDDTESSTDDAESSTDDAESSSSSSSDDVDTADDVDTLDTAESDTDRSECECIADQAELEDPVMPICGEMLCDVVNNADDPQGEFGETIVTTPEALECALIALRDRTPGIVSWGSSYNGGQFSETGYVLIYDNGEAVRREWGANDLSYDVDPAVRFDLPDAVHYEDCLANPSESDRYYCLRAYAPLDPPPFECVTGWSESDT